MEYKLSEAWEAIIHTRPVNWITNVTAWRSEKKDPKNAYMFISIGVRIRGAASILREVDTDEKMNFPALSCFHFESL